MENLYHDVHDNKVGVFNTRSGLLVDLNNPTVDMICAEDIAHALGNICRFGGHTDVNYSVLEHSFLVAALAPYHLFLEAILHDGTEAYLGDVIKPLKNILGSVYTDLESKFEDLIIEKYGLIRENLQAIKKFDREALELEHRAFILGDLEAWAKIKVLVRERSGGRYFVHQFRHNFIKLVNLHAHNR